MSKVIKFRRKIYVRIVIKRKDGIFMTKDFHIGKNALIFHLQGEIDQHAATQLKERIDIEIESSTKRNLIIDLKDVVLMDSSGIGLIVGRYKLVSSIGGKFAVCGASEHIRKMLELSGITKIIKHYKTIAEAEKAFTL